MINLVNETLASGGPGTRFKHYINRPATLTIQTLTGAASLEISYDDGINWTALAIGGAAASFTGPLSVQFDAVSGALFRVNQTSGTGIKYRVDVS